MGPRSCRLSVRKLSSAIHVRRLQLHMLRAACRYYYWRISKTPNRQALSFVEKIVPSRGSSYRKIVRIFTVTRQGFRVMAFPHCFQQAVHTCSELADLPLPAQDQPSRVVAAAALMQDKPLRSLQICRTPHANTGLSTQIPISCALPGIARAGLDLGSRGGVDSLPCRSEADEELLARR